MHINFATNMSAFLGCQVSQIKSTDFASDRWASLSTADGGPNPPTHAIVISTLCFVHPGPQGTHRRRKSTTGPDCLIPAEPKHEASPIVS